MAAEREVPVEELSALVKDFESQSSCRLEAWRFYDVECSVLPLTPWQDPDHWSASVDLACDDPSARIER